jgi:glycosyltransferase involved in cell wall biosynthesis
VAGYFLQAFKSNPIHYYSQKVVRKLIEWFADMVIVTNPTMYHLFPNKKKTWINGGIDLKLAGLSDKPKIYDAVFCGRIHPTKGIDELLEIWDLVREKKPNARLAIIGDGDLGIDYIKHKLFAKHGLKNYNGIDLLGYMGDERYEVYKQSKVVLYPTPLKYDHFSMAPVEAMACGCHLVCFYNPVNNLMLGLSGHRCLDNEMFAKGILAYEEWMGVASCLYAQKFDYEQQSLRVFNDLKKELYEGTIDGRAGHGGNGLTPGFVGA